MEVINPELDEKTDVDTVEDTVEFWIKMILCTFIFLTEQSAGPEDGGVTEDHALPIEHHWVGVAEQGGVLQHPPRPRAPEPAGSDPSRRHEEVPHVSWQYISLVFFWQLFAVENSIFGFL